MEFSVPRSTYVKGFEWTGARLGYGEADVKGDTLLVHFEEYWQGKNFTPYCPRLPLKWLNADGVSGWLQFSGSWTPEGQKAGFYRSHVRPFKLRMA